MTAISDFFGTVRFLLGDHDPTIQQYGDTVLLEGVRACIRLQGVPGLALAPDLSHITPEVTDPNQWALVCYHTVRGFVQNNPDRYSYKTRPMSESFGSWQPFLDQLQRNIYKLESGAMFSGWHNYYTWLAGLSGLPLELVMASLNVRAPFHSVSISADGVSSSGSSTAT
jgi:hypothetical protein